jgi:ribokinase
MKAETQRPRRPARHPSSFGLHPSPAIVVIGSINMDLVCRTPRLPGGGETVIGGDLLTIPGGKGANQAVAASRLGGDVHMVGRVGDDDLGRRLLAGLRENGVDVRHVKRTPGAPSGCAMILVDKRGENAIVVSPGANAKVMPADVDAALPVIRGAAAVVLQLEIPLATVRHAASLCRKLGVPTILDPAPVPSGGISPALYGVDVLTPNEHEAALLAGTRRRQAPAVLATSLLARGPSHVVLKLGGRGALARADAGWTLRAPAFKVKAVDTTAAGDAFTGALAVALGERQQWGDALRFANAAGALCCTTLGAQPSLPTRADIGRLLRK